MRKQLLIATVLSSMIAVSFNGSAYYVEYDDGTREEVVCEQNGGQVGVDDATFPAFAWVPKCVEINSGESVTWTNDGVRGITHDPGSELDDGDCFRALNDNPAPPAGSGPRLPAGAQWTVTFRYSALSGVEASFDGGNTWRDCSLVLDIDQSTLNVAVLPYKCFQPLHQAMQGLIVIRRPAF